MKANTQRSSLFLMELILGILFFSVAAAVCVKLFVTAHVLSKESVDLNHSVAVSQNLAEIFYGTNGSFEKLTALPTSEELLSLDKDNQTLSFRSNNLEVHVALTHLSELLQCQIQCYSIQDPTTPVYQLEVSLYPGSEVTP